MKIDWERLEQAIGRILDITALAERAGVQRRLIIESMNCLLYTSPSPRDRQKSRMPSSA